jgi:hypothetical protein
LQHLKLEFNEFKSKETIFISLEKIAAFKSLRSFSISAHLKNEGYRIKQNFRELAEKLTHL